MKTEIAIDRITRGVESMSRKLEKEIARLTALPKNGRAQKSTDLLKFSLRGAGKDAYVLVYRKGKGARISETVGYATLHSFLGQLLTAALKEGE